MEKHVYLVEKIVRVMNLAQTINKQPKNFGTDIKLYPSEIHMIEAISNHMDSNASELSQKLGITNGAVNQMMVKLINKGLIEQYQIVNNKKEVFYKLTEIGEIANREHNNFHKDFYDKLTNQIPEQDLAAIHGFLDKWLETIKEYSEIQ